MSILYGINDLTMSPPSQKMSITKGFVWIRSIFGVCSVIPWFVENIVVFKTLRCFRATKTALPLFYNKTW